MISLFNDDPDDKVEITKFFILKRIKNEFMNESNHLRIFIMFLLQGIFSR